MGITNRNYDLLFLEEKSRKIDKLTKKYYFELIKGQKLRANVNYLRLRF